jgi:hypothetical protein
MPGEVIRAHVLMPRETVEAIDRVVGRRGRSRFVADAAEEKLRRLRLLAAADRIAGSLANVDTPGWNTPAEVLDWVRGQRRADEDPAQRLPDAR